MNIAEIEQTLRKWPQAHVYYHDNGSWIIYEKRPDDEATWLSTHPDKADADYLAYVDGIQAMVGDDSGMNGYVPPLVEAMAIILGMSVESV